MAVVIVGEVVVGIALGSGERMRPTGRLAEPAAVTTQRNETRPRSVEPVRRTSNIRAAITEVGK